jgi:hypothetical protein
MLKRVKIREVGDTHFLVDDQVEKFVFEEENARVMREGKPQLGSLSLGGSPSLSHHQTALSPLPLFRRPPRCSPRQPWLERSTI